MRVEGLVAGGQSHLERSLGLVEILRRGLGIRGLVQEGSVFARTERQGEDYG